MPSVKLSTHNYHHTSVSAPINRYGLKQIPAWSIQMNLYVSLYITTISVIYVIIFQVCNPIGSHKTIHKLGTHMVINLYVHV